MGDPIGTHFERILRIDTFFAILAGWTTRWLSLHG